MFNTCPQIFLYENVLFHTLGIFVELYFLEMNSFTYFIDIFKEDFVKALKINI